MQKTPLSSSPRTIITCCRYRLSEWRVSDKHAIPALVVPANLHAHRAAVVLEAEEEGDDRSGGVGMRLEQTSPLDPLGNRLRMVQPGRMR